MAETNWLRQTIENSADSVSGFLSVQDQAKQKVNEGALFVAGFDMTATQSTDPLNIVIKTDGTTGGENFKMTAACNKGGVIYIQEDYLSSGGGGTTGLFINANRISGATSPIEYESMLTTFSSDTADVIYTAFLTSHAIPVTIDNIKLASSKNYDIRFIANADATRFIAQMEMTKD